MDFVDLANGLSEITETLLRHLTVQQEDNGDDDFARLEGDYHSSSSHATTTASTTQVAQEQPAASGLSSTGYYSPEDTSVPISSPLLSPTAEAELYLLATNFLLYVAMVIITIMVAKIYFPEALDRGVSMPQSRTFNYRMADAREDYYGSDAEEDDEDEEDDAKTDDDDDDDNEILASDEDEDMEQQQQQELEFEQVDETDDLLEMQQQRPSTIPLTGLRPGVHYDSTRLLEFEQLTMSKTQVFKRLTLCVVMLNLTFVTWGVLQERMLTRRYPRYTGEYFTYSYALVFTNRFWTLIMSGCLWAYFKPRRSQSTVIYEYSFPSISNMLSSWCQYEALRYVSFPATTLFKSFKLAPVMAMGKILGNKSYPQYDYMVALWIGIGITMFMASTDDMSFGYDYLGEKASAKWTGVMLLFLFLFFDSFTSQFQSRMFQRHPDLSMVELMFGTSAFSTVLSAVTLVHTKELYPALAFVYQHSEIHLHFFTFSICSTIGQIFIFYTIKNFGAVVFTLIMTTRILLSIGLSCILYGHEVNATGFFGLVVVMGAVLYRIKRKAEGKQLVKWQGMDDDKAHELVREWHEHIEY
ncbi:Adenosine 3'-phospho 5'-phosphosulfate transporter 1 [Seminavis robusta]|uniref:Adenosine 3'-phospho 5'-phosphosulfate transporter 1 n=1 Tax=Seminavis robusta TaxID=568900 RepID=A0A9N8H1V8_9STRA|nr:Adenosine 3'-phospho 5'-phosphosulfate transporter 1 [Seminavis robusta]|eukprot:Sro50_g029010.1 Adenosine 3'-phospho 5'-phosphosulfate transporter 1 (583) ;mRNA; f:56158-58268